VMDRRAARFLVPLSSPLKWWCCNDGGTAMAMAPPPKNVERDISEYVDCKKGTFFLASYLLTAKFPRPSSHTSNTVDKLNKSKLSGLVNVFTLVLLLVHWWCCCCCLFLWQWTMVSLTAVVTVEAVVVRRQRQRWRWWQWTTIGGESGRQCKHWRLHDGVR
jgi:hypothetical protein